MKIKTGYVIRHVMDTYLILAVGGENYVPNQIMSLNEAGALLWKILETGAEECELREALIKEYGIDETTADIDVDAFIAQLKEKALIVE